MVQAINGISMTNLVFSNYYGTYLDSYNTCFVNCLIYIWLLWLMVGFHSLFKHAEKSPFLYLVHYIS